MTIAGNRLRRYLDLYHHDQLRLLGLPRQHDERDTQMAEATLRALPPGTIRNGLGSNEDPVHLHHAAHATPPRHLIQILNEILARPARQCNGLRWPALEMSWKVCGKPSCG